MEAAGEAGGPGGCPSAEGSGEGLESIVFFFAVARFVFVMQTPGGGPVVPLLNPKSQG